VVAEGGYHDFVDELEQNSPHTLWFAPFFRFGARAGYRLITGEDMSVLSPISAIVKIAPRPILLIYGTNEPGLNGARLQQQATRANAELWEVDGARHGNYLDIALEEYEQRVLAFLDAALISTP
jgi:pimeloyl-ACP methyl ester carboxylesterase